MGGSLRTYNTMKIDIMNLYCKPHTYKFNDKELKAIRSELKKRRDWYVVKYGFYKKNSKKGAQIAFIIDSYKNSPRKSGVENQWEIFCERELTNIEFEEIVQNFGTNKRRFQVWYYKTIKALIDDDKKYNIDTPKDFVKECIKRGFNAEMQTIINFVSVLFLSVGI